MNRGGFRTMYQLARADALERMRSYSFLVTLAAATYLAYATYAGYITMVTGSYRGIYNSAWLGTFIALSTNLFVILAGFYIVKSAIDRDRKTGVGQILATTPISKFSYILAKLFSNFIVLMAIVAVQMLAALFMQLLKAEDTHINLWTLYAPFLFLTIPAMAFTAGIAVLFESIPFLSKGLGNVVFFFLWAFMLSLPIENDVPALDITGLSTVQTNILSAVKAKFPDYKGGFGINAGEYHDLSKFKTYVWEGVNWTPTIVAVHLAWFGYALLLGAIAAAFFDRFDMSRSLGSAKMKKKSMWVERSEKISATVGRWTSFGSFSFRSRFGQMLLAEIRLMLKGVSVWWYLVSLILIIVSLSVPLDDMRQIVFPLMWLWPILIWSKMGTREARSGTEQIMFSMPHILARQLPAMLAAGVLLSLLVSLGVLIRFCVAGEFLLAGAAVIGAMFVPSLALTSAVWSRSSKLFEAVYLCLWYIGPMNHVPELDFTFGKLNPLSFGLPLVYVALTLVLIVVAVAGRRRQMTI